MQRSTRGLWLTAALVTGTAAGDARAASARTTLEPAPAPIFSGSDAEICAFPGVVALDNGFNRCTGTLVHPRLVLYAAHCGAGDMKIGFGQSAGAPEHVVTPETCMVNPDYAGADDEASDWAFCRLAEPAPVPPIPVALGCEQTGVETGMTATIVGYGQSTSGAGDGPKRVAEAPIRLLLADYVEVGGLTEPGPCAGDSGGPALIKAADGTWRTFGIASVNVGTCGGIGHYSYAANAIPWVEENAGLDITRCHDEGGGWQPDFRCTGFAVADSTGAGAWTDWCAAAPRGPASTSCGPAFDASPDTTPPTVAITSPASGPLPGPSATVAIEVDAADVGWGVAKVSLEIAGEVQAVDDEPPFAFEGAEFPAGEWTVVAIAEDAAGQVTRSEPVTLAVGDDPASGTGGDGDAGCGCRTRAPGGWTWLAFGAWWIRPGRKRR